ncbi:hypothetical protein AKO1_003724 [Acrasis kona]|uniref:Uncharacterized protein n=1 Tax=Acrasis kona TaxID=1008807 RepID=A0AAW2YND0_9EUKA
MKQPTTQSPYRQLFPTRSIMNNTPASIMHHNMAVNAAAVAQQQQSNNVASFGIVSPAAASSNNRSSLVSPVVIRKPQKHSTNGTNGSLVVTSPTNGLGLIRTNVPTTPHIVSGLSTHNKQLLSQLYEFPTVDQAIQVFAQSIRDQGNNTHNKPSTSKANNSKVNDLYKAAVQELLDHKVVSNLEELRALCVQCMDESSLSSFTNEHPRLQQAVNDLILLDLYYYYKLFHKYTYRAIKKVSKTIDPKSKSSSSSSSSLQRRSIGDSIGNGDLSKTKRGSLSRSTFGDAKAINIDKQQEDRSKKFKSVAMILKDAAHYMYVNHNTPFERIMYEPNHDDRAYIRNRVTNLCEFIVEETFALANSMLLDAQKQFHRFTSSLQHVDMYGQEVGKCATCALKEKRLKVVKNTISCFVQSLNFVERLLNVDPNNAVYSNMVMRDRFSFGANNAEETIHSPLSPNSQRTLEEKHLLMIVDDDNGNSFIDQCFPIDGSVTLVNLSEEDSLKSAQLMWQGEEANVVNQQKEVMMQKLTNVLRDNVTQKNFIKLCDECSDLLKYLRKQEKTIKNSHLNHHHDQMSSTGSVVSDVIIDMSK